VVEWVDKISIKVINSSDVTVLSQQKKESVYEKAGTDYFWLAECFHEKIEKEYDALVWCVSCRSARGLIAKTEPCAYQDFALLEEFLDRHAKTLVFSGLPKGVVWISDNKKIFQAVWKKRERVRHGNILQNEKLYRVYKKVYEGDGYKQLTAEQKMAEDLQMRDFRLNGVALPADKKTRFKKIELRSYRSAHKFDENLVAAAKPKAWRKLVTKKKRAPGFAGLA